MYEIYTDGSCLGNPGRGGWGVVSDDFKLCGKQGDTTNNVMEMTAILKALEECLKRDIQEVCIFTDSQYVKNGIVSFEDTSQVFTQHGVRLRNKLMGTLVRYINHSKRKKKRKNG